MTRGTPRGGVTPIAQAFTSTTGSKPPKIMRLPSNLSTRGNLMAVAGDHLPLVGNNPPNQTTAQFSIRSPG